MLDAHLIFVCDWFLFDVHLYVRTACDWFLLHVHLCLLLPVLGVCLGVVFSVSSSVTDLSDAELRVPVLVTSRLLTSLYTMDYPCSMSLHVQQTIGSRILSVSMLFTSAVGSELEFTT